MAAPPYMKLYWGDYYRGTRHLRSPAEHGVYLLLIGALWDANGKLPNDDATLARHALCTPEEWASVRDVILPFFRVSRGNLTHKRVTEELAKYGDTVRKRKAAGKAGGTATARNHTGNGAANAEHKPTKPEPEPEPEPESEKKNLGEGAQVLAFGPEVGSGAASQKRGARLKPDWRPSAENIAFAMAQGFTEREVDRVAEKFRDYWTAATGKNAVKLDWTATWRNWVRTEAERRGHHGATPAPKRTGFV